MLHDRPFSSRPAHLGAGTPPSPASSRSGDAPVPARVALLFVAGLALIAGCSTPPPDPLRPLPPPDGSLTASTNAVPDRPVPQAWWTVFQDSELERLITLALDENRDLQKAAARLDAARARAKLAGAEAALQVTGSADANRSRRSESTAMAFGPKYQTDFGAGLQFAYEVDLWGRIRATREAAAKNVEFSAADQAAASIAIAAEVAKNHFYRLAARREAAVLERQIAAYADTENLQAARADAGFSTDLDVERVRIEKATREAERASFREREQAFANALSLLCGQSAALTPATNSAPGEAVTPDVPSALSLDLLEKRPDVAAKRAKWEAAFQRVQAARAEFYPTLRLTGSLGTEAERPEDLLDWQSRLWSLAGGLTGPVLDGGRLQASLAIERAGLREAAADYEAEVLTAYREVADALNALRGIAERQQAAERVRAAARRALVLSRERYEKGFVTYLEVVESDRAFLAAERTLIQLQAGRQTATVDLIRALGIP